MSAPRPRDEEGSGGSVAACERSARSCANGLSSTSSFGSKARSRWLTASADTPAAPSNSLSFRDDDDREGLALLLAEELALPSPSDVVARFSTLGALLNCIMHRGVLHLVPLAFLVRLRGTTVNVPRS